MGTFVCGKCRKRWPDVAFFCCPRCHPRWAMVHVVVMSVALVAVPVAVLAGLAWLVGLL